MKHFKAYWLTGASVVMCCVVLGAVLGHREITDSESSRAEGEADRLSSGVRLSVQSDVDHSLALLTLSAGHLEAGSSTFSNFNDWADLLQQPHTGLGVNFTAFSWNGLVTPSTLSATNALLQESYNDSSLFVQDVNRQPRNVSVMYPVTFIAPLSGNEGAIGFDLYSIPTRQEALDRAAATDSIVTTTTLTLVQSGKLGLICFFPLHTRGVPGFLSMVWAYDDLIRVGSDRMRANVVDSAGDTVATLGAVEPGATTVRRTEVVVVADIQLTLVLEVQVFSTDDAGDVFLVAAVCFCVVILVCLSIVYWLSHRAQVAADKFVQSIRAHVQCVAHDVKSPASVITMVVSLLDADTQDSRGAVSVPASNLQELQAAATMLSLTVSNMLTYEQHSMGGTHFKLPVNRTPCNVRLLCARMEQLLRHYNPSAHDVPLGFTVSDAVPTTVLIDEPIVSRILMNLLTNARKYSPSGGVASVAVSLASAHELVLEVADQGAGIPDDKKKLVFKAFSRLDRDAQSPGSGLGLAMVATAVKALGGNIWVSDNLASPTGNGSVFTVRLPIPDVASRTSSVHPDGDFMEAMSVSSSPSLTAGGAAVMLQPLRMLLVEDTLTIQRVFARLVSRTFPGCALAIASSCADARRELESGQVFDVVVLDETLPDGSGSAMYSQLRDALGELPPVLMFTSREDSSDLAAGCGTSHTLPKMCSKAMLKQGVIAVVGSKVSCA